jgi:hypothetical protein
MVGRTEIKIENESLLQAAVDILALLAQNNIELFHSTRSLPSQTGSQTMSSEL